MTLDTSFSIDFVLSVSLNIRRRLRSIVRFRALRTDIHGFGENDSVVVHDFIPSCSNEITSDEHQPRTWNGRATRFINIPRRDRDFCMRANRAYNHVNYGSRVTLRRYLTTVCCTRLRCELFPLYKAKDLRSPDTGKTVTPRDRHYFMKLFTHIAQFVNARRERKEKAFADTCDSLNFSF